MENIISYSDISSKVVTNRKSILLLYKSGHQESECAYHNLEVALQNTNSISAYTADVDLVLDIHPNYGITSVPSLLIFDKGMFKDAVNGCHTNKYYKSLMDKTFFQSNTASNSKDKTKNVTVYSTPSCSWCTALKKWLQENGIEYKDIDISFDEKAAMSLIKRSGHKGVPQIEINEAIVVGFQLPRLKELLEIK